MSAAPVTIPERTLHKVYNLLSVVIGFTDVLLVEAGDAGPGRAERTEIRQAAVDALELLGSPPDDRR